MKLEYIGAFHHELTRKDFAEVITCAAFITESGVFLFCRDVTAAQHPKVKITSGSAQSGAEENVAADVAKITL